MIRNVVTRFRAYYLNSSGSSFSYFADERLTVIEARLTEASRSSLVREMGKCGVAFAHSLQITSWDADHCEASEIGPLLELIKPRYIERPGYRPYTANGIACSDIIDMYQVEQRQTVRPVSVSDIDPAYITALEPASALAYGDVYHNPLHIDADCANNNSTVTHFRQGSFNVLSLGDVESANIGARLRRSQILCRETDVMILAHHGADNGFTTKNFLRHLEPSVAICSSNYGNQYDHPRQEIRDLLYQEGVKLFTTKTGDVVIKSLEPHQGQYRAINLIGKNKNMSSSKIFTAKKSRMLTSNDDTIRQAYARPRHFSW